MAEQKEVNKWLEKAWSDYSFSSSVLPDTSFYAQVCFFFQQSAEKYLKAYIIKYDLEFKKIHDLASLLDICRKHEPTFASEKERNEYLYNVAIGKAKPPVPVIEVKQAKLPVK